MSEHYTRNFNGSMRRDGKSGVTRFALRVQTEPDDRNAIRLPNPATVALKQSTFHDLVRHPHDVDRVLVDGMHNAKLGRRIVKGPWAGLRLYQLTLEERATCPTSCTNFWECFGNGMPMARRHRHGPDLERKLAREIPELLQRHRAGIAVRLHVLGDFYSEAYARRWTQWLRQHPRLRIWGYTAHPIDSAIGAELERARALYPDRMGLRYSVPPGAPDGRWQVSTAWKGESSPGIACPAEQGRTAACVTCGLCWSPAATRRVVFMGHGTPLKRQGVQR